MNFTVVRLKPLTDQVKRLADAQERTATALEAICTYFGVRTAPITEVENQGEPEVTYATDEATALRELEEEAIRLGYKPPVEES